MKMFRKRIKQRFVFLQVLWSPAVTIILSWFIRLTVCNLEFHMQTIPKLPTHPHPPPFPPPPPGPHHFLKYTSKLCLYSCWMRHAYYLFSCNISQIINSIICMQNSHSNPSSFPAPFSPKWKCCFTCCGAHCQKWACLQQPEILSQHTPHCVCLISSLTNLHFVLKIFHSFPHPHAWPAWSASFSSFLLNLLNVLYAM